MIGDDLLDPEIRQQELRNWTDRIAGVRFQAEGPAVAWPPKGRMTCPVCKGEALASVMGPSAIELDQCSKCGGLWFDWGEAGIFTDRKAEFQKMLDEAFVGAKSADRDCPRCDESMLRAAVKGKIEIDQCPSCEGLWLDDTELETLLTLLPAQT